MGPYNGAGFFLQKNVRSRFCSKLGDGTIKFDVMDKMVNYDNVHGFYKDVGNKNSALSFNGAIRPRPLTWAMPRKISCTLNLLDLKSYLLFYEQRPKCYLALNGATKTSKRALPTTSSSPTWTTAPMITRLVSLGNERLATRNRKPTS